MRKELGAAAMDTLTRRWPSVVANFDTLNAPEDR